MSEVDNSDERLRVLLQERARLLAFVERRVGSREMAEEILQEAFVRGVEKIAAVRDDESVVAWFYRLLRNAIIDRRRRHVATERVQSELAREWEALAEANEPDERERGEICTCMSGLVDTLKPEYESAIRTVDLGGGTVADLARANGISAGNAAVRLHRARQALGQRLRVTCGACAEHGCLDCGCRKSDERRVRAAT
ncbi:sigma-70 family RNA polymerase sigma factor [Pendulispora rubella]|uniref:Sigma-70 family RNA polymerase sigma factor n=1 Tax=Pendulispora rubella TaxID=2741070 RepID=A0ABZ2LKI9_9BACT